MLDFFNRYKKIFLLAGFFLIVFLLAYALYYFFFKTLSTPELTPKEEITYPGQLPSAEIGPGQIIEEIDWEKPISELITVPAIEISETALGGITTVKEINYTPSLGINMDSSGNLKYYDKIDGKFYRINQQGNIEELSDKVFHNVQKITWSPTKEKAILEYPDESKIIFDFETRKQISLPKHFKDFEFSPQGDRLVMKSMGLDPDNRWLVISNEDGSKAKAIESLGTQDNSVFPSWSPNQQVVALHTKPIDLTRQEVFFIGQNGENFKSAVVQGYGFEFQWSPQGDRLLHSVYSPDNETKPLLWVTDANGNNIGSNRKNLGIETWASKCVFANDTEVYCAVPRELEAGAGMFPQLALQSEDRLFKIDIQTGLKKIVAVPDGVYNMSNLMISPNEEDLYFQDWTTERIYQVKLK